MTYRVLAADDETELLDALELFFAKENIELIKAKDGIEALEKFRSTNPQLLLLDIMMPGMDGFQLLRTIRKESNVPALMLTARDQDVDKILGLQLGADDYITKPYNPLELVARVKAQLRRTYDYLKHELPDQLIEIHDLTLNPAAGTASKRGEELPLTRSEYLILELLMQNAGRVLTKQQLFEHARQESYLGDENTVMMHISNLRSKIEDNLKHPRYIRTIRGLGYRFELEK